MRAFYSNTQSGIIANASILLRLWKETLWEQNQYLLNASWNWSWNAGKVVCLTAGGALNMIYRGINDGGVLKLLFRELKGSQGCIWDFSDLLSPLCFKNWVIFEIIGLCYPCWLFMDWVIFSFFRKSYPCSHSVNRDSEEQLF